MVGKNVAIENEVGRDIMIIFSLRSTFNTSEGNTHTHTRLVACSEDGLICPTRLSVREPYGKFHTTVVGVGSCKKKTESGKS